MDHLVFEPWCDDSYPLLLKWNSILYLIQTLWDEWHGRKNFKSTHVFHGQRAHLNMKAGGKVFSLGKIQIIIKQIYANPLNIPANFDIRGNS